MESPIERYRDILGSRRAIDIDLSTSRHVRTTGIDRAECESAACYRAGVRHARRHLERSRRHLFLCADKRSDGREAQQQLHATD
jgi:hypothetical protein